MAKNKVIYWHRLGLKVYEVGSHETNLLREIESTDLTEIQEHLSFLKDSEIYLLLSDAISYLFKKELPDGEIIDDGFRSRLLEIVKSDIPEDFSDFSWDYKIVENEGKREAMIFAPTAEIQAKINELSKVLAIKFVVIEPESISAERDPNPILGIVKKNDVKGKDDEVLNIVVDENPPRNINFFKLIIILGGVLLFIAGNYYLYSNFIVKKPVVNKVVENIVVPTVIPTPTTATLRLEDLNIVVQNGTKISGKAGRVVDQIKALGVTNVSAGNADNKNYTENKVYFKSDAIKSLAQSKLLTVVKVGDANVLVDNSIENDVKLILGIN